MDPLHFFIGAAPVAVYLFLVGLVNLSRRPFLTTGARDTAALGIGILWLGGCGSDGAVFTRGGRDSIWAFCLVVVTLVFRTMPQLNCAAASPAIGHL